MPDIALNYDTQSADIQRRLALAQALQQQSMAPITPHGSYKGIEAPISKWEGANKLLQAYLGARGIRKANEAQSALQTRAQQEAADAIRAYHQPQAQNTQPAAPGAPPAGQMPAQAPMAPPPIMPPQQAPQPQSPMAQPNPMAAAASMMTSTNPFMRQLAPTLMQSAEHDRDRNEDARIHREEREADLSAASAQKASDLKADIDRAKAIVAQLPPTVTADQRAMLNSAAQNGTAAVMPLIAKQYENGFKDHFVPATPDDLKGYPAGTTGQKNATTGEIVHVYNPTADRNSTAQAELAARNAAESARHNRVEEGQGAARIGIEAQKAANGPALRPIPSSAASGMAGNRATLGNIDRAIQALDAYPTGVGLNRALPNIANQHIDPKGVDVRGQVANIGSQLIHDRSGAAVTISESPRLMPFIPLVTDSAEVAKQKLNNLKAAVAANLDETEAFYGPESGYRSPPPAVTSTTPANPAQNGVKVGNSTIREVR